MNGSNYSIEISGFTAPMVINQNSLPSTPITKLVEKSKGVGEFWISLYEDITMYKIIYRPSIVSRFFGLIWHIEG